MTTSGLISDSATALSSRTRIPVNSGLPISSATSLPTFSGSMSIAPTSSTSPVSCLRSTVRTHSSPMGPRPYWTTRMVLLMRIGFLYFLLIICLGFQERVSEIARRVKVFLDGACRDPTDEIQVAARLVVRPRTPRTAEWLLTHNGSSWFVVDVKVSSVISEPLQRASNDPPILSKYRTGQGIRRGLVHQRQHFVIVGIIIHKARNDRTEYLLAHRSTSRIIDSNHGGLDEIPLLIGVGAAVDELDTIVRPGMINIAGDALEGGCVDNGIDEVREVFNGTHPDLGELRLELASNLGPQRPGQVRT